MFQPCADAFEMRLVEIARPPGDLRGKPRVMHHVLPGAAAGLQHVAGFTGEEFRQHSPDRLVIPMERWRIEPAVRFDRPAIPAEFHYIISHDTLPDRL